MLIHVYSNYLDTDPKTKLRMGFALWTWRLAYRKDDGLWRDFPVPNNALPRTFNCSGRQLPFVKDLIQNGVESGKPDDVIVLTNSDTCCCETITDRLLSIFRIRDCCYAHRRDFLLPMSAPLTDEQITFGQMYPGYDLFAFRVSWWQKHGQDMLDMVIGAEGWDLVLKVLMDSTKPAGQNIELRDCIYHEAHKSHWFRPENHFTLPSQVHNLRLAGNILIKHGFDSPQLRKLMEKESV